MSDTPQSPPQRILVIETLYLGDLVHTLPLIQALRRRYPEAELDVLVRAPHVDLMRQVNGIDRVLAMDPKQHRHLRGLWALCRDLRARAYDLVINPGASDRATILTALSGGRRLVGRLNRNRSRWLWPLLHHEVVDRSWGAEPMYWQKLTAFREPLQLELEVQFGLEVAGVDLRPLGLPSRYIHLSPFASEDIRCLPPATVVMLLRALKAQHSDYGLVVSAGPSSREQGRLGLIQSQSGLEGVLFLPPSVDLPTLSGVIAGAELLIGPDSGPLHLARALDTPAVACFLYKDASSEWMPIGPHYSVIGVATRFEGGLYGLPFDDLLAAVARQIDIRKSLPRSPTGS